MKKNELRELNQVELNTKLQENMESLQNYRFQLTLQQLEDKTLISKVKKVEICKELRDIDKPSDHVPIIVDIKI